MNLSNTAELPTALAGRSRSSVSVSNRDIAFLVYASFLHIAGTAVMIAGFRTLGLLAIVASLATWGMFSPSVRSLTVAATFALVSGLFGFQVSRVSGLTYGVSAVAIIVCFLPFLLQPLSRYRGAPIAHLFGLTTATYLIMSAIFSRPAHSLILGLTDADRIVGIVATAMFVLVLSLGATARGRNVARGPSVWRPDNTRIVSLLVAGYIAFFVMERFGLRATLGSAGSAVDVARLAALAVLFLAILRRSAPRWALPTLTIAVGFEVVAGTGTAAVYEAAAAPLVLLAVFVGERRRVPWLFLALAVATAFLLNVTKSDYRALSAATAKKLPSQQPGVIDSGIAYLDDFSSKAPQFQGDDLSSSAARFAYSAGDLMSYATHTVPELYDYWGTHTYRTLPFALVPRALVPGKPNFNFGNQFGREYGLLGVQDYSTSQNLPLGVEAYISFGWWGILVVGFMVGLSAGWLSRRYRGTEPTAIIMGALVTVQFMRGVESDSLQTLAFLPILVLAFPPLLRWVTADRQTAGSRSSGALQTT